MTIFNRFGLVVFKTTNPNDGWNATYKKEDQPIGMYLWQINLINIDNEKKSAKGTFILLR